MWGWRRMWWILKKINPDSTKEDFPPDQLFEIGIIDGSQYGKILSLEPSPLEAEYFKDFEQPFKFIAADSIDSDSVMVRIRAGIPDTSSSPAPMFVSSFEDLNSMGQALLSKGVGLPRKNNIPETEFVYEEYGIGDLVIKDSVVIKVEVADNVLEPLGRFDNKPNPNYNPNGPDKRTKIVDFSKVEKTTATVKVMDKRNKPISNYNFTMQALVCQNSGGHDHSGNRPIGSFITAMGDTVSTLSGKTDSLGKAVHTFLSSGIGGIDSIFVQGKTPYDTASTKVFLKIGDFELLQDGANYNLVGSFGEPGVSSQHIVNHHGTPTFVSKIKALADSVYADSSYVLRINDMSLKFGGPFDINNDWDTPHETHREGVQADIDDVDANGTRIDADYLRRRVKKKPFGGNFLDEGNHFHVTIR